MSKCFDERLTSISSCSLNLTLNYLFNFKRNYSLVNDRSICCLIVGSKSRLASGVQRGPRGYCSRRLVVDFSATCDRVSVAERAISWNPK